MNYNFQEENKLPFPPLIQNQNQPPKRMCQYGNQQQQQGPKHSHKKQVQKIQWKPTQFTEGQAPKKETFKPLSYFIQLQGPNLIQEVQKLLFESLKNSSTDDRDFSKIFKLLTILMNKNVDKVLEQIIYDDTCLNKISEFLRKFKFQIMSLKLPQKWLIQMIKNIVELFYYYIQRYQDRIINLPITDLDQVIQQCINQEGETLNTEMKELQQQVNQMNDLITKMFQRQAQAIQDQEDIQNQNIETTYQDAEINPCLEELIENKKQKNIFKHINVGSYISWDRYLNNMFYLMREVKFYFVIFLRTI